MNEILINDAKKLVNEILDSFEEDKKGDDDKAYALFPLKTATKASIGLLALFNAKCKTLSKILDDINGEPNPWQNLLSTWNAAEGDRPAFRERQEVLETVKKALSGEYPWLPKPHSVPNTTDWRVIETKCFVAVGAVNAMLDACLRLAAVQIDAARNETTFEGRLQKLCDANAIQKEDIETLKLASSAFGLASMDTNSLSGAQELFARLSAFLKSPQFSALASNRGTGGRPSRPKRS